MLVLSCSNLRKTYIVDTILDGISFTVENGDKIGVIGLNGSGKTTLFNILSGEVEQDSGEIYIQKDIKIGYLKQHTKIESNKTIFDECLEVLTPLLNMEKELGGLEEKISLESQKGETNKLKSLMDEYAHLSEKFLALNGYGYKSEIKGVLKGLGFSEDDFDKEVNILSGGQKSRLSLAKLLLEKPDILLLDEPTNHLDIDAIGWLEKFLKEYKGAALIISHDRYFLDNVVNRIFHIENLKMKIYNANYTEFMARRKKDLEIYKKHFEDQQREIKRQEEIIARFKSYGGEKYHRLAQSRQKLLDKMKVLTKPTDTMKAKIRFEPKIKSGRDVLKVEKLGKSFGDLKLLEDINFNIYRGEKVGLIGANGIGKTTLFKIVLNQ
ncbi:MAG: ABC-F family ATP-binding cassette domain-containing protein, partial [Tissierellia bacterium]|nr:ABC-F family ATP-binding cassette domain-containing protein [Tissierellia bacterium]